MKKTIIITIAMLCVFGAVVMFGADKVSTDWQQPSEDDVEISTVSPVERVEQEYKIYNFQTVDNCDEIYRSAAEYKMVHAIDFEEGMLTVDQAASYCGAAIEKYYPEYSLEDKNFLIALIKYPYSTNAVYSVTYMEYIEAEKTGYSESTLLPYFEVQCEIDAYTGKVFRLTQSHYGNDTGRDEIKLTAELTEKLAAKAVEIMEELGYSDYKKYIVSENHTNTAAEIYVSTENDIMYIGLISVNGEIEFNSFVKESYAENIKESIKYMNENGISFASEG